MSKTGKSHPSDITDEEWDFVVSYLTLMEDDVPQRTYSMRSVFNALRCVVKTGCPWRYLPNDFPVRTVVYQQARRRVGAKVFESIAQDLRMVVRMNSNRAEDPTAVIMDARTLQSTPESGARAGNDGAKRRKGSKGHAAVDTLGNLLPRL